MTKEQENNPETEPTEGQAITEPSEGQEKDQTTEPLTQPEIDKKVGEAVFKALENERKKQDKVRLEADGKHEELAKQLQAELDDVRSKEVKAKFEARVVVSANEAGLSNFSDVLGKLPDEESLNFAIGKLNSSIDAEVEKRVNDKLANKAPAASSTPGISKKPDQMTPGEYAAYRIEKGYQ